MINKTVFVPKILLCGNPLEFFARVGQRPYELVGQIKFGGEINGQAFDFLRNGVFVLGDKVFGYADLPKIMRGGVSTFSSSTANGIFGAYTKPYTGLVARARK